MYFVARKVSMPSVESMQKKERAQEQGEDMYLDFSKQLNQLINTYFSIEKQGKLLNISNDFFSEEMEVQIAGSEEERNELIPLCYIETHREKAELESEVK